MKSRIIALSIFLSSGYLMAQEAEGGSKVSAGNIFIGGELIYASETTSPKNGDDVTNTTIKAIPIAGYMLQDNIAVGGKLGIDNDIRTEEDNNGDVLEISNNRAVVGLFGRYYMPVAGDKLFFRPELGIQYFMGSRNTKSTTTTGTTTEKKNDLSGFGIGLGVGFDYFVGDHLSLNIGAGLLSYESENEKDVDTVTRFGLSADWTDLTIGANWWF